jgi:hypothetical protein
MDMRFRTWNVRSVYRSGSLETRDLAKYKLDLMGVQEGRWDKCGTEPADDYTAIYGNGNADHHLLTGFIVHKGIMPAVKRAQFVSDRMTYLILRGRWCDIYFSECACTN